MEQIKDSWNNYMDRLMLNPNGTLNSEAIAEYIEDGLQEMVNEGEIDFETAVKIKEYLV